MSLDIGLLIPPPTIMLGMCSSILDLVNHSGRILDASRVLLLYLFRSFNIWNLAIINYFCIPYSISTYNVISLNTTWFALSFLSLTQFFLIFVSSIEKIIERYSLHTPQERARRYHSWSYSKKLLIIIHCLTQELTLSLLLVQLEQETGKPWSMPIFYNYISIVLVNEVQLFCRSYFSNYYFLFWEFRRWRKHLRSLIMMWIFKNFWAQSKYKVLLSSIIFSIFFSALY